MDPRDRLYADAVDTVDLIARAHAAPPAERTDLEEQIVRRYQPMTRRLAAQHSGHGWDTDDLVQVANVALLKAIRRFNSDRGCFESYAKATISGELKNHLRDYSWSIKPPRRVQELQLQIRRTTEELAQAEGELPTALQLADYMDRPVTDISEALSASSCHSPSSIDQPLGLTGRPLSDTLCSDEEVFDEVEGHVALMQICSDLPDDDRDLIRLRFFECMSQREIAEELGISQMQVSRRLAGLIDRLRERAGEMNVA